MSRFNANLLRIVGLLCLALFGARGSDAQFVRAYVVEDSVTVGDRFTLVLVAEHSQPDSVRFPAIATEAAGGHEIGDIVILRKLSAGKRLMGVGRRFPIADTVAYEATTFAIDSATVAPIQFSFTSPQRTTTRQTDPFSFPVTSVLTDDASDIRDIGPLANFPSSKLPYVILLLGLIIGYLVYRWLTRPQPEVIEIEEPVRRTPPPPAESPLAEANRRLAVLEKTPISTEEAIKPFYVELSDILRTYIERRLHLAAMESTSAELVSAMRAYLPHTRIPAEVVTDLDAILETADLAKFADKKHPQDLCRLTLSETRVLILRIEDSFRPTRETEEAADDGSESNDSGETVGKSSIDDRIGNTAEATVNPKRAIGQVESPANSDRTSVDEEPGR